MSSRLRDILERPGKLEDKIPELDRIFSEPEQVQNLTETRRAFDVLERLFRTTLGTEGSDQKASESVAAMGEMISTLSIEDLACAAQRADLIGKSLASMALPLTQELLRRVMKQGAP